MCASCAPLSPPGGQDAELVAFGIGEDDPRFVPGLSDIDLARSEVEEAGHLGGLIPGPEIRVQAVLHHLPTGIPTEQESGQAIGARPDLDLVVVLVDDHPAEGFGPPAAERMRIGGIDDDLLLFEFHVQSIGAGADTAQLIGSPVSTRSSTAASLISTSFEAVSRVSVPVEA